MKTKALGHKKHAELSYMYNLVFPNVKKKAMEKFIWLRSYTTY